MDLTVFVINQEFRDVYVITIDVLRSRMTRYDVKMFNEVFAEVFGAFCCKVAEVTTKPEKFKLDGGCLIVRTNVAERPACLDDTCC